MRTLQNEKGFLEYVLENCERAFNELGRLHTERRQGLELLSTADIGRIGNLHRIVQDYLVVRVAGLFDSDDRTISFAKWFFKNPEYRRIRNEPIIKHLIKLRHNFVAHNNEEIVKGGLFPETQKILDSNLGEVLLQLKKLLRS